MGWEGVVIWAGRRLLYADKPRCRKAAPSKISVTVTIPDNCLHMILYSPVSPYYPSQAHTQVSTRACN